jgi:hypothetical protein
VSAPRAHYTLENTEYSILKYVVITKLQKNELFQFGIFGANHPIMRLAVESHSEAAFVLWCCTHKSTIESKKIQHCKTLPSSIFCCLFSVAHGFASCRYCSKKAFCSCIQVVVVGIIDLLKIFC